MWNVIKSLAFSLVGMFSPFIQIVCVCVWMLRKTGPRHGAQLRLFGPLPMSISHRIVSYRIVK